MKIRSSLRSLLLAGLIVALPYSTSAAENSPATWKWDSTIYGLAAGMSGDVTAKGINADVNTSFSTILENLELGFMGTFRASKGPWAVSTDVIYMGLGAGKGGVSVDLDQWVVEPTVGFRINESFELLAGLRYNSISGEIRGPSYRLATGSQTWLDPIVGFNWSMSPVRDWSIHLRADVGGFGVGSDLTWQALPSVGWHFSDTGTLQMGYRWVYNDYTDGSGARLFRYDVLSSGPQVGVNFRF